jgi:hypothetical protein
MARHIRQIAENDIRQPILRRKAYTRCETKDGAKIPHHCPAIRTWQFRALLRGPPWGAILNAQECASAIRTVGLNALPNALQSGDPNRLEFLLDFKLGATLDTAFECRGGESRFSTSA